ncbi:carbohydrate sulfotransferase 11-like [Haliotis rufescens]|uniref:carbohydrate sulfotransferase 11-like n=1 Tax=Haliotis rufescens TaxID=6454 RepID=UPI001EB00F0A|nr:carbohydrate sulfotransferase 11-like [Haliotis rufescens]
MKMWLRLFTVLAALGVFLPMMVLVYMNAWTMSDGAERPSGEAVGRKVHYKSRDRLNSVGRNPKGLGWRDHLEEKCEDMGIQSSQKINHRSFNHIIVDKKYKVLYCQVPKVACTNWRRVLLVLSGKVNVTDPMLIKAGDVHKKYDKHLTYLSDLSMKEADNALRNYYKFFFVREPFERLLSAYRNKFQGQSNTSKFFHSRYGKDIIKNYRKHASANSLAQGNDVSFFEFVQYIVDKKRKEALNEHWCQFFELCLPCLIKYNFIGKYHQLENDSKHVLDSIGASSLVKFPTRAASYHHQKTSDVLPSYYQQIPPHYLGLLWKTYYPDFELFNYTIPSVIRNLTSEWNRS